MMRFVSALVLLACACPTNGQIVETMQDYAAIAKRFAEYAATATPTDDETLRNVLAAGAQGSASGASNGCPGCAASFIEKNSAPTVELVSDSPDLLKNVKVNVGKQQEIPQELISLVEKYEAKRNEQEQGLLEAALHSLPEKSSFLARENGLPVELRVVAGKRFPSFYAAVRDMESKRRASEQKIRTELVSMLTKGDQSGSAKALAQTVSELQKEAYENPAAGERIAAEFSRIGKASKFIRRPEVNVKYEFPVSDFEETPRPTLSFTEINKRIEEESDMVTKLGSSVQHSRFLRDGSQYDRKTQAPIVWLHLNDKKSAFVQQAITPSIDLYLEQQSG